MKYIVKNCPALIDSYSYLYGKEVKNECARVTGMCLCKDRTDCPIKQIVEKCLPQSHIPEVDDLKEEILQILQVEEVE